MEMQKKLEELTANEEFKAAYEQVKTPEELAALFAAHGIEVPMDLAKEMFLPAEEDNGEISEEALSTVAGGGPIGTGIGTAIGNGLFYGAGYLGGRLAGWSKKDSRNYAKSCGKFGSVFGSMIGGTLIPA